MLEAGTVLRDRYRIEKPLGKGGMGAVYLATDLTFGSQVALKETIVHGSGLEAAFEREARVLNKLRHAAIPVVMDYFIDGQRRFLVMQYIPGDDLSTLIERARKPFPPERVLEWADRLLDALTYIHTQDPPVIHRDIKPQNLKLTEADEIVLLDFGLSKSAIEGDTAQSVSIFGYTPSYAPIEQVQGAGTDQRSDIYSLGATLYHVLTGVKPLDSVTRAAAATDPLRPIHRVAPAVSQQVSDVIMSAMAILPENRPATAAELRSSLRGAAFDDLIALAHGFGDADVMPGGAPDVPAAAAPRGPAVGAFAPAPAPAPDELATVVGPREAMAVGGAESELSTMTLRAPDTDEPPPWRPVTDRYPELPTVVNPMDQAAPEPPPARRARARQSLPPSTVSFVFETGAVSPEGKLEMKAKRVARHYFEDTGGGQSLSMVEVPRGAGLVGSPDTEDGRQPTEGPQFEVVVPALFVARWPITQAQWRAVATSLPRVERDLDPDPSHFPGPERPVEMVSWEEAVEFCERLSAHTGRDFRLPSESAWEYVCRSGTSTPFAFGTTLTAEVANVEAAIPYGGAPAGDGRSETTPVGSLGLANGFGVYDMHGNVWEWTADCWHDTLAGAPRDGSAWDEGGDESVRVIRGGGWASIPADARSATRFSLLETGRRNDVGFRVVMVPPAGS